MSTDASSTESGGGAGSGGSAGSGDAAMADARSTDGAARTDGGVDAAPVACLPPIPVTAGTAATLTVNLGGTGLRTVSPDMMGIHTSVYDGQMQSPTTPALLQAAGVTSLRYPGGSYGDSYHWELNTGTSTPAAGAGSNVIYIAPGADFGKFIGFMERVGGNALITVNYGTNPAGNGPGSPLEAAAWVAYANGLPSDTKAIGTDASGNWQTVGYWASLRAAAPIAPDDGRNFLRISHPAPVGIKYWEVGNELYGNGYYYGNATSAGWEPDMHVPYTGTDGTARRGNPLLSPATYAMGVRAFSTAMKAVDPTVKVGAIVHWPFNEYSTQAGVTDWNATVLPTACGSVDFVVNHWYAGTSFPDLLTRSRTDVPPMFSALRTALTTSCPAGVGANMPIAITEWGPNLTITPPAQTQLVGIFAAEAYAHFMEQGALSAHWLELHSGTYLGQTDTPAWGYHGQQIAHYLAGGGDTMLPQPVVAGAAAASLQAHASRHADGSLSVMVTNISGTAAANVTVNLTGGTNRFACAGTRYAYTPVNANEDGPVTSEPIFASAAGDSVSVAVPAYSVVVVAFPAR